VCVGETIVFYRTAIAAWLLAVMAGRTARISDLVVVLTLAFLAFGRVGCFRVACCHGRPARFGVRYTHAHARLGFPRRWVGRPLVPVQLFEAVASAVLAVAGVVLLVRGAAPGTATKILIVGYALVRFPLELLRGDGARPHAVAVVRGPAAGTRRGCTRARPRARCRDHRRHVARAQSRAAPNNGAQDSPSCAP
jgi:prolipoprotein diacylglyceryltransferase